MTVNRPPALARQSDAPGFTSNRASSASRASPVPSLVAPQLPGAPLPALLRALAPGALPPSPSAPRVPASDCAAYRPLDVGQLSVGEAFSVPRQSRSQPACNAATATPAIPSEPEAPAMSKASLTTTPEKPSSPRSRSCRTVRLIVAGWFGSTRGSRMCEVMINLHPASMAATNGCSSLRRNSSRERLTTGSETCESCAVSPCPGKCLALGSHAGRLEPLSPAVGAARHIRRRWKSCARLSLGCRTWN